MGFRAAWRYSRFADLLSPRLGRARPALYGAGSPKLPFRIPTLQRLFPTSDSLCGGDNLSGRQKEDKVFDAVIEEIRFGTKPAALVTKRKVKAIAYLSPEVLIADLKRNCVVVRSVVIKFFQIRQAD